jgi:hypothetical protein
MSRPFALPFVAVVAIACAPGGDASGPGAAGGAQTPAKPGGPPVPDPGSATEGAASAPEGDASATESAASAPEAGAPAPEVAEAAPVISEVAPTAGFVVHEWGTNTVVTGSDGVLLRGLHHEEEDLPAFVWDRMRAGTLPGSLSVVTKMETPVAYFHTPKPLTAKVSVEFPLGVLTQWYPAAWRFEPQLGGEPPTASPIGDPALDPRFPFATEECRAKFGRVAGGLLDWSTVEVLAPDADVEADLPEAPLDRYTWSHARSVAANPIRVTGVPGAAEAPQVERFLFYRGLGNVPLPLRVQAGPGTAGYDGGLRLVNADADRAIGPVFLLRVSPGGSAFTSLPSGVEAGATLDAAAPDPDASTLPAEAFADALGAALSEALESAGLYADEAAAMVATWRRQWFHTPGVRVLYLSPQAWTDAQIPLRIDPVPDQMIRVMVIRVEVLTPAIEDEDYKFAAALDSDPATAAVARAHFDALGRFAEPRLRRALAKLGSTPPGATAYLDLVAGPNASAAAGE